MRLTMCARGECPMCKYEEQCDNWDFRMELATKNMNILAEALRKTEPTISKMEQVEEPKTQTKTQKSNLTFEKADEPQTDEEYINNLPWTEVGNGEQTDCDHKCIQTEIGCEKTDCAWK